MHLKPFRGTHDHLPDTKALHTHIEKMARTWAARYGFSEITTPIFEYLDVFLHTLGNTSDVVTKEMFILKDRHDESLALRPEGTAGVMRAVLSNKLVQNTPLKYFYIGPMFRYERPQSGRLRQFHQVGVEHIGEASPLADAEIIALAHRFLQTLSLKGAVSLELNTLGDTESRASYRDALVSYFHNFKDDLSEDSKVRLDKNPLRILDSKHAEDQHIIATAPRLKDYLNDVSRCFFERVQQGLSDLNIPFTVNPLLVRGLDYYGHTAFEFKASHLGAQSAVLAGGRYDGLSQQMGGPNLPSVGWAAGIERLAMLSTHQLASDPTFVVVPLGQEAESIAWQVAQSLRDNRVHVHLTYEGSLKSRMKKANKFNAFAAIILGDEEVHNKTATVKILDTGMQRTLPLEQLESYLKSL